MYMEMLLENHGYKKENILNIIEMCNVWWNFQKIKKWLKLKDAWIYMDNQIIVSAWYSDIVVPLWVLELSSENTNKLWMQ